MLNEKRITSMCRMNLYSKGRYKKDVQICEYYKYDYISLNIIITSLWLMFIYAAIAVLYCLVNIDFTLNILMEDELKSFIYKMVIGLVAVWFAFGIPTFFIYRDKYQNAQENAQKYYKELYKVNRMYAKEEQE